MCTCGLKTKTSRKLHVSLTSMFYYDCAVRTSTPKEVPKSVVSVILPSMNSTHPNCLFVLLHASGPRPKHSRCCRYATPHILCVRHLLRVQTADRTQVLHCTDCRGERTPPLLVIHSPKDKKEKGHVRHLPCHGALSFRRQPPSGRGHPRGRRHIARGGRPPSPRLTYPWARHRTTICTATVLHLLPAIVLLTPFWALEYDSYVRTEMKRLGLDPRVSLACRNSEWVASRICAVRGRVLGHSV